MSKMIVKGFEGDKLLWTEEVDVTEDTKGENHIINVVFKEEQIILYYEI